MDSSVVSARLIGSIFVEKGLITEEQLELALEQQRATGERIGEILVEQFGIERLDLASVLAEQWAEYERQGQAEEREAAVNAGIATADLAEAPPIPAIPTPSVKRPIGEIFVERGLVSDAQLEEALEQQRTTGTRLGEILVASGKLSRLELASALADQWATFQKLRPPAEAPPAPNGDGDVQSAPEVVLPTPEVVIPSATPPASAELTARIDSLAARVDQVAREKVDWKPQVEKTAELLRARIGYLEEQVHRRPEGGAEDLRPELAALGARIDAIPAPSDEWRQELAQVADNLRIRIERVEQVPTAADLAELRSSLTELAHRLDTLPAPSEEWRDVVAELSSRIDALPAPSEEWREQIAALQATVAHIAEADTGNTGGGEELRASLDALAERVESMPAPSDDWRDEIESIRASLDALSTHVESLQAPSEEWREQLADLSVRIDSLPRDAWRPELAEVAENLRTRIERVEHGLHDVSPSADLEELRASVGFLSERIDSLPKDAWRPELGEVAENLRTRIERVEEEIAHTSIGELDALRAEVAGLSARLDSMPAPSDEIRAQLADLAHTLNVRVDHVEQRLSTGTHTEPLDGVFTRLDELASKIDDTTALDDVLHRIAAVAGVAGRVDQVEQRLATDSATAAGLGPALNELKERAELQGDRIEALARGLNELADRRDAGVVEQELLQRIDSVEHAIADLSAGVAELPSTVEDRIAAVESWAAALSTQAVADVEALRSELAQIAEGVVGADAVADLRSTVEQHGARVDALSGEHAACQRHTEERAAGRSAELSALRARLETVESALSDGSGWTDAIGEAYTRVDRLESRLVETMASEAVERNAEIEAVRLETSERLAALEGSQVKRKDLRELRDAVERVEQRVDERTAQDGTATRAVEEAVRDGLAALGERLIAAEASYLNAGRALSRSIEGLGHTISGADAHLAGVDVSPATDAAEHSSFVAFAPTAEGYRLVACDGGAPVLGDHVEIPEYDGVLVVTRVGASPLPFDTRPCVYLEHA